MVHFNLTQTIFLKSVNDLSDERQSFVLGQGAEARWGKTNSAPISIHGMPAYWTHVGCRGFALELCSIWAEGFSAPLTSTSGCKEGFSPFLIDLGFIL